MMQNARDNFINLLFWENAAGSTWPAPFPRRLFRGRKNESRRWWHRAPAVTGLAMSCSNTAHGNNSCALAAPKLPFEQRRERAIFPASTGCD